MEVIQKCFPFAFAKKANVLSLIISIILHLIVGLLLGWLASLVASATFIGILVCLVFILLDLYFLASLVLSVLDYFKILK